MTEKEIKTAFSEITGAVAARKLKPAFDHLEKLIRENNLGVYLDEYRNLEET